MNLLVVPSCHNPPVVAQVLSVLLLAAGLRAEATPTGSELQKHARPPAVRINCERESYECAMHSIESGNFDAAVVVLGRLLASAPGDLKTLNLLGIALTGAGRIEEANRRFNEALTLDANFQPARRNLAVNEFNQRRVAHAERLFNELLKQVSNDDVAHVYLGEIHYGRKQPALAVPHYEKSGERVAANPVWLLHYASCLLEQSERARAVELLDRLPGDDGASQFEAGVLLGRAEAHADAARHFGLARPTYKEPYAAGYNQTLMLIEAGDHEGAIRVADELFRANFKTGELYNLVSRAYVASNRIQEAYDALRTAAKIEPSEEQHYLDLALICLDHENFDLGMEIVDVGLQYKPAAARLHVYRGVLLVMKGLVEQAEGEFEKARALGTESGVPDVALAMAWMQSGNTPKAVDVLRARMKAGSREAIVPYMLGIALMRTGVDPTEDAAGEAIRAFEQAIRLDPQLAGPRTELGKILVKRGDTARAVEHLERAASLDPENPAPAYLLAQAYRRLGDTARAQELLARVSKLNAQGRGDDPDKELKRTVLRIVREGATPPQAR